MKRHTVMWALILIGAGALFLVESLGLLPAGVRAWGLIWPLALLGLGVWVLYSVLVRRPSVAMERGSIPLAGARQARVRLHHGAGRLVVGAGAAPELLLSGEFAGGATLRTHREGDLLVADLSPTDPARAMFGPWGPNSPFDWSLRLNRDVALALELEVGASDNRLDLAELQVNELILKTGASAADVTLPAHAVLTRVRIDAGAAGVKVRVPQSVAARIRAEGALAETAVDTVRFPRAGDGFQSPDYDTAANRADIEIHAAVGSVQVL
ncbi:MAG: hypothetical protein ACUVX9_07715 [Anaerolineae bacterium]